MYADIVCSKTVAETFRATHNPSKLRRRPNIKTTLARCIIGVVRHPRKHEALNQCCLTVGPPSMTLAQH